MLFAKGIASGFPFAGIAAKPEMYKGLPTGSLVCQPADCTVTLEVGCTTQPVLLLTIDWACMPAEVCHCFSLLPVEEPRLASPLGTHICFSKAQITGSKYCLDAVYTCDIWFQFSDQDFETMLRVKMIMHHTRVLQDADSSQFVFAVLNCVPVSLCDAPCYISVWTLTWQDEDACSRPHCQPVVAWLYSDASCRRSFSHVAVNAPAGLRQAYIDS